MGHGFAAHAWVVWKRMFDVCMMCLTSSEWDLRHGLVLYKYREHTQRDSYT